MMVNYTLQITDEGVKINGVLINESIFQEEKVNYSVREREDQIESLINWISEAKGNDKELMKEDLKYLINLKDEYLFSSISTNEYILKEDNKKEFENICKEILKLNEELKNGKS